MTKDEIKKLLPNSIIYYTYTNMHDEKNQYVSRVLAPFEWQDYLRVDEKGSMTTFFEEFEDWVIREDELHKIKDIKILYQAEDTQQKIKELLPELFI